MLKKFVLSFCFETELKTLPVDTRKNVPFASKIGKSLRVQDSSGDIVGVTATIVYKRLAAVFVVLVLLAVGIVTRVTVDLYDSDLETNSTSTARFLRDTATVLLHARADRL